MLYYIIFLHELTIHSSRLSALSNNRHHSTIHSSIIAFFESILPSPESDAPFIHVLPLTHYSQYNGLENIKIGICPETGQHSAELDYRQETTKFWVSSDRKFVEVTSLQLEREVTKN